MDATAPPTTERREAEARERLGALLVDLREARKMPGSTLAGLIGVSAAFLHQVEAGRRPVPIVKAMTAATRLGVDPTIAAELLILAFDSVNSESGARVHFLASCAAIGARHCELLGGSAIAIREAELLELSRAAQELVRKVGTLLNVASDRAADVALSGDLARKNVVPVGELQDFFPGESEAARRDGLNRWFDDLHSACKLILGKQRLVFDQAPLPTGTAVIDAMKHTLHARRRGRKHGQLAVPAWNRGLDMLIGPPALPALKVHRRLKLEAAREKWLFAIGQSAWRERIARLEQSFPESWNRAEAAIA